MTSDFFKGFSLEDYINFYLDQGLTIIPGRNKDKTKYPIEWKEFQERKPTKDEIETWKKQYWNNSNKYGIAIVCGDYNTNFYAVDIDNKEIFNALFPNFKEELKTWITKTGREDGGYHICFKSTEPVGKLKDLKFTKNGEKVTIEFKGKGKLIRAPPSIHETGKKYKPIGHAEIDRFSHKTFQKAIVERMKKLGWEKEKIRKKKTIPKVLKDESVECVGFEGLLKGEGVKAPTKEDPGERNTVLFSILRVLKSQGVDEDYIQGKVENFCENTSYPLKEGLATMQAALLYDYGVIDPCDLIRTQYPDRCDSSCKILEKIREPTCFFDANYRLKQLTLAKHILRTHHFTATIDDTHPTVYYYNDKEGLWFENGRCEIRCVILDLLGDDAINHRVNEVIKALITEVQETTDKLMDSFNSYINLIPLKNGVYDIKTKNLIPYIPEQKFTMKHPVKYDPKATCPKIEQFIKEVLGKEYLDLVYEITGYSLYRTPKEKGVMCWGEGANGKTILLRIIEALLGKKNVSAVSLQDILESKFLAAELQGKNANIYPDIPKKALHDTSKFKALTGNQRIAAQRKHQHPFTFLPYALQFYSCNKLPKIYDPTYADWRRLIFLKFQNKYCETEEEKQRELAKAKTDEEKTRIHLAKDRDKFLEELTTEEELSGFFNKAIEGLERVLETGCFSEVLTKEEQEQEYIKISDPPEYFWIEEPVIYESGKWIPKQELYDNLGDFCADHKLSPPTYDVFNRWVRNIKQIKECYPEHPWKTKSDGTPRQVHSWKGITTKVWETRQNQKIAEQEQQTLID